jgi:hypothetical protein
MQQQFNELRSTMDEMSVRHQAELQSTHTTYHQRDSEQIATIDWLRREIADL